MVAALKATYRSSKASVGVLIMKQPYCCLLALLYFAGCQQSHSSKHNAQVQHESYMHVKILSRIAMKLDEDEFNALSIDVRKRLSDSGIDIIDELRELRSPDLPLAGRWLRIDNSMYFSDEKGIARIKNSQVPPNPEMSAYVFWELDDAQPIAGVKNLRFVRENQESGGSTRHRGRGFVSLPSRAFSASPDA